MAMKMSTPRIPFTAMKFKPDLAENTLAPDEYNGGRNIETNNRGINSVYGDEAILSNIPGNVLYVDAGYRDNENYSFIVVTLEGKFWNVNAAGIFDVTPGGGNIAGYNVNIQFTSCWSGDVFFLNDTIHAPYYLLPTETEFRQYDAPPDNYIWNYNPNWISLSAGFLRIFSTPNVGSILIAGNLTAIDTMANVIRLPTTIRWSQSFGTNSGPQTWAPTLTTIANELEIPVKGPIVDGFVCQGNFIAMSQWEAVIFSPIAYTSTSAPILGIQPLNQSRGLLNENCWANADGVVYGLDARDIWMFNGTKFTSLGNQQVKDYLLGIGGNPGVINSQYSDRIHIINNTDKNQIEIYYPNQSSANGDCNEMIAYRYDFQLWQPPRDVSNACSAVESPVWTGNTYQVASRGVVYAQGSVENSQLVQKDIGTSFLDGAPIAAEFLRTNITFGQPYSAEVLVHRILPELNGTANATVTFTVGGANSIASPAVFQPSVTTAVVNDYPWVQIDQNSARMVTLIANATSATDSFTMSGLNFQITVVSDDR
jgi:hypothetical protein